MLWYPSNMKRGAFRYPCNIFPEKNAKAGPDVRVWGGLICSGHSWQKGASWNLTPPPATPALPHITQTLEEASAPPSAQGGARTKSTTFTTVILFSTKTVLYYIEVRHRLPGRAPPPPLPRHETA